jgi:glutamate 5-kinase
MGIYNRYFQKHNLSVAQSLCERGHFANRSQFLQLKQTYETLWASGAIPIANENDVVSDIELKFSDNDELATLLAAGFGAETLMFSTSVGGFLDAQGKIIPQIPSIDESVWSMVDTSKSSLGLGGMASKLSFAQRAGQLGIRVIIFAARDENSILNALEGKTGTAFSAQKVNRSLRQKWMSTGSLVGGKLYLDEGAVKAVQARKSLLAVGIVKVEGNFHEGETVELFTLENHCLALAQTKISSQNIMVNLKTQKLEVAHADYIVVL